MTSRVSSAIFYGLEGLSSSASATSAYRLFGECLQSPTMSVDDVATILEHYIVELDWPNFCEELTRHQGLNFLGAQSVPLQEAKTAGALLRAIEQQLLDHAEPLNFRAIALGDGWFTLNSSLVLPGLTPLQRYLCMELCVCQTIVGLRNLLGPAVTMAAVHRRFTTPPELDKRQHCLGVPVKDGEIVDGLLFKVNESEFTPESHVSAPRSRGEPWEGSKTTGKFDDIEDKVELVLRSLIPHRPPRVDDVARSLQCDKRTLQRHLSAGTGRNFRDIYNRIRFEVVLEKLAYSRASIRDIAVLAGYEEASNFSRAFKSRYGISPRQWRAQA